MSDEEGIDFEASIEELKAEVARLRNSASTFERIAPWVKLLVGGAIIVAGWATTVEIRQQSLDRTAEELRVADHEIEKSVSEISLWRERTEANRFTSQDANSLITAMTANLSSLDKRQARTEDAIETVRNQLDRIEQKLTGPPTASK
jgi:hypothetical protein